MGYGMATRPPSDGPQLYLKEHREARNISAPEMAKLLGTGRTNVLRIERSQRLQARWQARYAAALKISPAALWTPPGAIPQPVLGSPNAPEDASPSDILIERIAAALVDRVTAEVIRRLTPK